MQTRNHLLDDLAKVAGGALSVATGIKRETEVVLRQQFEKVLNKMDLISREDFEAVRAMAAKARNQQEELSKRVAVLETALKIKPRHKSATKKTAIRRASKKSPARTTKPRNWKARTTKSEIPGIKGAKG